jgi:hypothetical protein
MVQLIRTPSGPNQEHCSVKYLFNVLDKGLKMVQSDKICCPFIHLICCVWLVLRNISDELQFVNIFSTNKIATLCSVGILCLLICINEIIQVTKGQKYFPERLYFDQSGFGWQAHVVATVTSRGSNKTAQMLTQWWLEWMWCKKMLPQCIIPPNDDHVHLHVITFCGNSLRMKCTPIGLQKSMTCSKEYSKQSQLSHSKRCNE